MNLLVKKSVLIRQAVACASKNVRWFSKIGGGKRFPFQKVEKSESSYFSAFKEAKGVNLEEMISNLSNPKMVEFLMSSKKLLPFLTDHKTIEEVMFFKDSSKMKSKALLSTKRGLERSPLAS